MGRENLKKTKKVNPKELKKKIKKEHIVAHPSKKALAETAKLKKRKERKEMLKKKEKRKEAVEEEELKIEKELFDKQGYYSGPLDETVKKHTIIGDD